MAKTLNLIICLIALCSSFSMAESVKYSYDDAGNRIKREIILSQNKSPQNGNPTLFSERLTDREIKIYPNPTKGQLKIEIEGFESEDQCKVVLFNMSGQQIYSSEMDERTHVIDLSARPNGIYILHLILNGTETTWKIIKE